MANSSDIEIIQVAPTCFLLKRLTVHKGEEIAVYRGTAAIWRMAVDQVARCFETPQEAERARDEELAE